MVDPSRLLAAYDEQLRTHAETSGALQVARHRELYLVTLAGGRGFITYRALGVGAADEVQRLVSEALAYFRNDPDVTRVEWKTRGHDRVPALHGALLDNGFVPDEPESIMIGEARSLATDVTLPDGVTLRQVTEEADVRAMIAMQCAVFGDDAPEAMAEAMLKRLAVDDQLELWVAEADGQIVSAGRLESVPDTDFAGIWGGATLAEWRGRGIYRALTAKRAQSAIAIGKTFINSDSTEYSRPILERSGLVKVSTTTPYHWRR
jgi:GNAT superfamily N-acetyltransferase